MRLLEGLLLITLLRLLVRLLLIALLRLLVRLLLIALLRLLVRLLLITLLRLLVRLLLIALLRLLIGLLLITLLLVGLLLITLLRLLIGLLLEVLLLIRRLITLLKTILLELLLSGKAHTHYAGHSACHVAAAQRHNDFVCFLLITSVFIRVAAVGTVIGEFKLNFVEIRRADVDIDGEFIGILIARRIIGNALALRILLINLRAVLLHLIARVCHL